MPTAATAYIETIGPNEHIAIVDHGKDHFELTAGTPYDAAQRAEDFCRQNNLALIPIHVTPENRTANLASPERRVA